MSISPVGFHEPEKQLKKLIKRYEEKQRELEELQHEINSVKEIIARHEEEQQKLENRDDDSPDESDLIAAK